MDFQYKNQIQYKNQFRNNNNQHNSCDKSLEKNQLQIQNQYGENDLKEIDFLKQQQLKQTINQNENSNINKYSIFGSSLQNSVQNYSNNSDHNDTINKLSTKENYSKEELDKQYTQSQLDINSEQCQSTQNSNIQLFNAETQIQIQNNDHQNQLQKQSNPNVNFRQIQGNMQQTQNNQLMGRNQEYQNIIQNIRSDLYQELNGSVKQRTTATIVELQDKQKNNKKQQNQCQVVYIIPQKFRNVTQNYRILDDIFISETQIKQMCNFGDMELGGDEPLNSFKSIEYATKNHQTNTIQFGFANRPNPNSPPVEYLVERFKSMCSKELYKVSKQISQYINNKNRFRQLYEDKKFPQEFYEIQGLDNKSKDFYINKVVNEYNKEGNLFYLQQYSLDNSGYFRLENWHISTLIQKMFKVTEDEIIFSVLRDGIRDYRSHEQSFKQNLWLLDVPLYGIEEEYIDLEFIGENDQKAIYKRLRQVKFIKHGMFFIIVLLQNYNQIIPLDPKDLAIEMNQKQIKQFIKEQNSHNNTKQRGLQK